MEKFYFTFGVANQPYVGGWIELEAPNEIAAREIYKALYMPFGGTYLNCAGVYTEEEFKSTRMFTNGKNFDHGCWEKVSITRERFD